MIHVYDIVLAGVHHIENNIACQDACNVIKYGENLVVAAVADGLGSAEHSGTASKIAVLESTEYCGRKITTSSSTEEILAAISESFFLSQKAIEEKAESEGHDIDKYDTTLTLAVLLNDTLYYGHSGDSGIVALTTEGLYMKVTEQQRDEDNCVFPLFFKDKWVFGEYSQKVCSVFLATDGMLETLFPFYIRNDSVNIHVALARFFMDNELLRINEQGEAAVKARMEEFIGNIPGEQVGDDKTVVVLVNTSITPKIQHEDYYKEPDWAGLKIKHDEEWKRLAYPHMFDKSSEGGQA